MKNFKIYIAGSFATDEDRANLRHMIDMLKEHYAGFPYAMYVPMYFKVDGDFQKPNGSWYMDNDTWGRKVFENDVKQLDEADRVFVMYSGHRGTTGTPWEVGYAYAKNKTIIGYIPDVEERCGQDMSLMMLNSWSGYMNENGRIFYKGTNKHEFREFLRQFNQK